MVKLSEEQLRKEIRQMKAKEFAERKYKRLAAEHYNLKHAKGIAIGQKMRAGFGAMGKAMLTESKGKKRGVAFKVNPQLMKPLF